MPTDPNRIEADRPGLPNSLIDSLILYACSHYPTAGSIELAAHIRRDDARRPPSNVAPRAHSRRQAATSRRSVSMQELINRLLRLRPVHLLARTALTFPFWGSGLAKLFDFQAGVAEMAHFGLAPPELFNMATIIVQLGASAFIIANRLAWLGAGALAVFTGLTVLLVHNFWRMTEEPFRTIAFHTATEHVGIIGGLVAVAILAARPQPDENGPEVAKAKWKTS